MVTFEDNSKTLAVLINSTTLQQISEKELPTYVQISSDMNSENTVYSDASSTPQAGVSLTFRKV
jgi:hypothetical protein